MTTPAFAGGPATAPASRLYFLDGVDRGDGMTTDLAPDAGFLRVTSDRFDAGACADSEAALCFQSDYMVFSTPRPAGAKSWKSDGHAFADAGQCAVKAGRSRIPVRRIMSDQHYGRFEFYYDAAGNRLLGWSLSYKDEDGHPARDVWMLKGYSGCRKPKPGG